MVTGADPEMARDLEKRSRTTALPKEGSICQFNAALFSKWAQNLACCQVRNLDHVEGWIRELVDSSKIIGLDFEPRA